MAVPIAVPKPGSAMLEPTSIWMPSASSHEGLSTTPVAAGVTHGTIASIQRMSANSSSPVQNGAFVEANTEQPQVGTLSETEPPLATSAASSSRARQTRDTPTGSSNVHFMLPMAVGRATARGALCGTCNSTCDCDLEWELPLEASPTASLNTTQSHVDRGSFFTDETPAACGDTATLLPCTGEVNGIASSGHVI